MNERVVSLKKIVTEHLETNRRNLTGWDSGGNIRPSAPEAGERALAILKSVIIKDELGAILTEAGYDV